MATKILVIVLMITSILAYPTNARSLAMEAKSAADEQKEYFRHPLPPFFGGFGGLRGGIRPPFGLGAGVGGFGGGFGPFIGGGGTSTIGAGTGTGFGSSIGGGFNIGDNGGNNPDANAELGAGHDLSEGGDAAIGHDLP